MRHLRLAATLVMVMAIPSVSAAASRCREARHDDRVAGTVVGAIAGGLLGNAVSHGGGRSGGTVIGAVGGAIIGNQLAASSGRACPEGYEVYEDNAPRPVGNDERRQAWRERHDDDRAHFEQDWAPRGATWDRHWQRGDRLPDGFASDQRYHVTDYRQHRLPRPYRGYFWVRYGDGYIQTNSYGDVRRSVYGSEY